MRQSLFYAKNEYFQTQMSMLTLLEHPNGYIEEFEMLMKVIDLTKVVSFWCQSPLVSLA